MFEPHRKFLVGDAGQRLVTGKARQRAVEFDLIFGFEAVFVEIGIADFEAGLARRPAVRELAVDAVIVLVDRRDIGIVDGQIARRCRADRTVDVGRVIIFKAAFGQVVRAAATYRMDLEPTLADRYQLNRVLDGAYEIEDDELVADLIVDRQ